MTVNIVAVSHSRALASAARELAMQMVPTDSTRIALAAGTDDGGLGTDATAVVDAITDVSSPDGVLVVMDLGSAVLSTEMAIELLGTHDIPIRLTPAPFVEGLIAASVRASGGASLSEVAEEAEHALAAKRAQLAPESPGSGNTGAQPTGVESSGGTPLAASENAALSDRSVDSEPATTPSASAVGAPGTGETSNGEPSIHARSALRNAVGLHARPAAALAAATARYDAQVQVADVTRGSGPVRADSSIMLMSLGATHGDVLEVSASGRDAHAAVAEIIDLIESGFGEE